MVYWISKSKYETMKMEWMKIRFLSELSPEQESEFMTFYLKITNLN